MAESLGTNDLLFLSGDDSTYLAFEFLDGSSYGLTQNVIYSNGIRGTRQRAAARTRDGTRATGGQLQFAPTSIELDTLAAWIMGGTKSVNNIPFAEAGLAKYLRISRDGVYHKYDGVKVNRATFAASEGSPLTLGLDLIGIDEATSSAPTGPPAIDDTLGPYVMTDCVLSVGGSNYAFRQMQVTVDQFLEVKWNNAQTPSSITATDLMVTVSLSLPYGSASALYGTAVTGVAVVATFTISGRSLTLTMPAVCAPKQPIPVGGKRVRDLAWVGEARRTSGSAALVLDNDST